MKISFAKANIQAICVSVPSQKIDLEEQVDMLYGGDIKKVKRIQKSIGLYSRYLADMDTTTLDLCHHSCLKILKDFDTSKLDAIIFVTQTPDFLQPNNAHLLHNRLGLNQDCACFDVNQGCSGYVYGLFLAYSLIENGAQNILICAGDTLSKVVNPADSNTAPLFGDAGSATLVVSSKTKSFFSLHSDGSGWKNIVLPQSGFRNMGVNFQDMNMSHLYMDGAEVFNFSIQKEPQAINEILKFSNKSILDIDYVFFHQANAYIISNIARRLGLDPSKAPTDSIQKYGNTSSASIPLAICDKLHAESKKNFSLILSGFGVGLSWATTILDLEKEAIIFKPQIYQGEQND